mmetsp:Transcript_17590/g.56821  ORF Transcript_17590/g.56821 Transcript_17590/m.56821 type:complete len:224 (-) Transcript_17590:1002-1673(-)
MRRIGAVEVLQDGIGRAGGIQRGIAKHRVALDRLGVDVDSDDRRGAEARGDLEGIVRPVAGVCLRLKRLLLLPHLGGELCAAPTGGAGSNLLFDSGHRIQRLLVRLDHLVKQLLPEDLGHVLRIELELRDREQLRRPLVHLEASPVNGDIPDPLVGDGIQGVGEVGGAPDAEEGLRRHPHGRVVQDAVEGLVVRVDGRGGESHRVVIVREGDALGGVRAFLAE